MPLDMSRAIEPEVYIIHENDEWVEPLRNAFGALGTPFNEWHLHEGLVDLTRAPPAGVFYNRMSASSHTRGHRYAPELAAATLAWLKAHGRTVVNGERALQLEISKVAQYQALQAFEIRTPETIAAVGEDMIRGAASRLGFPLILKHNRAGKGLGVQLVRSADALEEHLSGPGFTQSIDGITLVQRYIEAPEPFITRVEFVGGKFLYAVRVDTSEGFELCPADVCQLDEDSAICAVSTGKDTFEIVNGFSDPLIPSWEKFLAANDIQVAGIEFIVDGQGNAFTYDVNTNTNYNPAAEAKGGLRGMAAIADYLTGLLENEHEANQAVAA